jgi:predicted Zn-dependent protease
VLTWPIRWLILIVLAIGLPLFIYLVFIADEPVFDVESDVELGRQSVTAIAADPEQYPLLSEEQYPAAYAYLRQMVSSITASDEVQYRDVFPFDSVRIIHDDSTLNAFCTPGGFIYVYSGIIRYLDSADHLAGVLGHEIAHAEMRHSSLRLQREFGVKSLLAFVVLAAPIGVKDLAATAILNDLLGLRYSREQEAESDEWSVRYLTDTGYACDGAAGFFNKIISEGDQMRIPEFLSDHPNSQARAFDITRAAQRAGCSTEQSDVEPWLAFQSSLPSNQSNQTIDE